MNFGDVGSKMGEDVIEFSLRKKCQSVRHNQQNFILSDKRFYSVRQCPAKITKIPMIKYRTVLQNWDMSCKITAVCQTAACGWKKILPRLWVSQELSIIFIFGHCF